MTRTECETAIAERFEEIIAIAKEYNPKGRYLTATYFNEAGFESYTINNEYFDEATPDARNPINICHRLKRAWKDVAVRFDRATMSYEILEDGVVTYEHLAEDEMSVIVRNLMP